MEKKVFYPKTTKDEDKIATEEGIKIFSELRKKYSNENIRDLDIVLNSLIFALVQLAYCNVGEKDAERFGDLIRDVFVVNLKKQY